MATYQTFAPAIFDTLAHFQAFCQFFGAGFTTCGWVAQTGHGELPATGSGASYAFTNPVLPGSLGIQPQANYVYRGAWVSGTTYPNGSNTSNASADLVTDNSVGGNGITYQKITVNVSTNLTTAPHSNATDWAPYQYEVWKSNGSNSSSLPIYIRIAYTAAGTSAYRLLLSVGSGLDSNGNIINPVSLTSSAPKGNITIDNGTSTSTTFYEMDFSGDADNVRWFTQRGNPTALWSSAFISDRSKNASGVDTNAFVYVGAITTQTGNWHTASGIIANPAISNTVLSNSTTAWPGVVSSGAIGNSTLNANGGICPFFIYPLLGYQAPPLLGCVGFHGADVVDGSIIYVWNYGAPHAYLVNTFTNNNIAAGSLDGVSFGVMPAILWE